MNFDGISTFLYVVGGGFVTLVGTAVTNYFTRSKIKAEAHKIHAEADSIEVDNISKVSSQIMEMMTLSIQQQVKINRQDEELAQLKQGQIVETTKRDFEINALKSALDQERHARQVVEEAQKRAAVANTERVNQLVEKIENLEKELEDVRRERDEFRERVENLMAAQKGDGGSETPKDPTVVQETNHVPT